MRLHVEQLLSTVERFRQAKPDLLPANWRIFRNALVSLR